MIKVEPSNNIFKTISVQTTYKCQMKCANCYLGDMLNNDKYQDVDLIKFEKAIKQLPNRCDIRFIGAEPTLNTNLFELVKVARAAGHRPSLLTNGLKLRSYQYAKALKEAGDYEGLQKLPKNASPIRTHNRCKLTGRPKGYMRQFGISRVMFREMANKGLIPGVKKASW